LDDLCGLRNLTGFSAAAHDAVSRDRDCAMQIIELFGLDPNRLLATPAETLRPCRILERNVIVILALLDNNLDLLILACAPKNIRRHSAVRLHDCNNNSLLLSLSKSNRKQLS